ncbi:MAG: hypothetical protein RDV48_10525 [Candidatus Eremiobacteraeota bacterium]|nr:hypothetical protein [Candidatus Eremiobacteraeota bacterium]
MKPIAYICLVLIALGVRAAEPVFSEGDGAAAWVLEISGSAHASRQTPSQGSSLSVGSPLSRGDLVETDSDSTIRILYPDGGVVTVGKGKSHRVGAGEERSYTFGKSFVNLCTLLVEKIQGRGKASDVNAMSRPMGATRGDPASVVLWSPRDSRILETEPSFRWSGSDSESYTFRLWSAQSQEKRGSLLKEVKNVKGNTIDYDVATFPRLRRGAFYMWSVTGEQGKKQPPPVWFSPVAYDERVMIDEDIEGLMEAFPKADNKKAGQPPGDDGVRHLLLGVYYEKRGLFNNALIEYKWLMDHAVKNDAYVKMYGTVLYKMGFPEQKPTE